MKPGPRFEGKAVMVTGSASGIGRASAMAFAAEGASVACLDFEGPGAEETVSLIEKRGGKASYVYVDVTDAESIRTATQDAVGRLGRLDVVHHNAGANGYGPIHEMPIEMWDHMFAVNTRGAFIAMKFQIPHLLAGGGGAIVLTGSVIQHASRPNAAAYAASKLALEGLAKSATLDYGEQGLRVNIVAPGTIDTPMVRKTLGVFNDEEAWPDGRRPVGPRTPPGYETNGSA